MESNATQIKDLVVAQSKSQERMTYMEKMLEESTTQIEALTEGQSAHQSHFQQTAEENKEHLRSLAEGQSEQAGQFRQFLASNAQVSSDVAKELKRQRQQAQKQAEAAEKGNADACVHNVHPPPRKIDMPIIGYDYGKITTSRKIKVDKS